MTLWILMHPQAIDLLGYIPDIVRESDPRAIRDQINDRYAHGGGWHPLKGWKVNIATGVAKYPGDPDYHPVAKWSHGAETMFVYQHAWVCIVQADGTYEMSRMD